MMLNKLLEGHSATAKFTRKRTKAGEAAKKKMRKTMSVLTNTEDESGDMLDMADKNSDDEIVPTLKFQHKIPPVAPLVQVPSEMNKPCRGKLSQANFALADKINTDALSKIRPRAAPPVPEQDLSEFDQAHPQVQAGSTDFPEIENTEIEDTDMKDVDYTREFDDIPETSQPVRRPQLSQTEWGYTDDQLANLTDEQMRDLAARLGNVQHGRDDMRDLAARLRDVL